VRLIRAIEISTLAQEPFSVIKKNLKQKRPFKQLKIGLNMDREMLYNRINERVDHMIEAGLVDEAKKLHKYKRKNALRTVGYQELFRYFDGEISLEDAIEKIKVNSRRYAKRQLSWFNRYKDIEWYENHQFEEILNRIKENVIS
jgi:tRNA dimethylallyltransferase